MNQSDELREIERNARISELNALIYFEEHRNMFGITIDGMDGIVTWDSMPKSALEYAHQRIQELLKEEK